MPCECHLYKSFIYRNLAKPHLSSESALETRYCKSVSNHAIHQSTNVRCNGCETHTTIWFEVWPHRKNVLPHHTSTAPSTLAVTCVTLLEKTRPSANFAQGQLLMSKPYVSTVYVTWLLLMVNFEQRSQKSPLSSKYLDTSWHHNTTKPRPEAELLKDIPSPT